MEYVDIIMPTYNCEKYIKQAIDTIKNQTYENWRIIIVDDKSTDNTIKIIKESIKDIKNRVILIEQKTHIGVAKCRNVAIRKSTNRFIAFLDADDMWKEKKLELQIKYMLSKSYYFTYTRYEYLKKDKIKEVTTMPKNLDYKKALKNTYILTSTVILDTNKIKKSNIVMPKIGSEDTATWWKILKNGYTAYGLDKVLTTYRITPNGLSKNKMINLVRTWNIYRKQEELSIVKTIYNFIFYILNATKKRVI